MSKDKPQNWWDADETVGTTAPAKNWWDDDEPAQPAPKPAPAMQMQPAPKPAPMPMQSGQPNISPMGGVGEFDPKAFAGLKLPQQRASTENPIITEQRRQQDLVGRNFAAQQPERMAKEQRWKDELAAMNAAGVIPFKNNGPDGPLELNQERPDQFFGRAAGSFVNSNIGVANTAAQVGLNTANAYGAGFDPAMQGAMAGGEYGDISQRVADAATAGGYAQNQQKIDDIIPSLPIPAAQTPGEVGADVVGNLAAVFTGWGAPVLKAGEKFSDAMAAVPGLSRTVRGVGVETGENAALAYGMGAGAAPPGSDRNMAGTQSAADPLNYVSIEALRALGRIPGQIEKAFPATPTNAGGARPGSIDTAALEPRPPAAAPPAAAVTPNAPAATPAPSQPTVTAVPSFQRQPQPTPTVTPSAAGGNALPPPPPAVATANAPVPTPGAVPPAGTLTPVGNGVAVDSFNNLPVKTRESVLRALEASGMNRQQAFDAITSLNDLPPDRANMFEFELIRRYGGPDKFPNLQANLTTMGSDFSIQTPKKGGSPQDVMNKSLLDQAQSEGDYLTRTAEQLFGEGKVATKEELEAFRTQLGGRYRTQLAETYPGMTRLRSAASKQALAATVDAGRKNLTDYLLRPDVIEQVPPWVQDQVMMQVSDDLRWLQKDDAGLQFASKANPELTPLLTSDQTLRYSPQLWRTLVQMYPTQVGHSLQSAYRAAIDDAFSGVSNAIDRTTAKKLMRLRGQSRVRANASDPNKRGVGLLHLLEEASPGYKKLRQEYGDVVGAQKAADMPDSFFRVAKDEEALADFVDVYENELTPLQQNAVRNGITTQIRQALKNKTEFTQPWEVDAASRGHLPNMTAISSQTFLEALPKVFGRDGERMADAIRLSRANVDNIQAINKNFASGTPKGIDIKANANQLYEHPASTKLNPVDNFATTMGSVGVGTAFVPGGQMVSLGLLTGAAGRALYRAYKQGKSLSPSQKEALAEWLFKPRRETDPMPPSTPRGFSKLGYAGNVATGTGIGAAVGAASSGGDPATTAEGAVIGALGGGARAGLRARRAGASIIKPPPARGPRRGPPPFGGNRVTGAGPAPQITPPGSPPVQNGFFGGGRKPPTPPKPPVPKAPVAAEVRAVEPPRGPVPSIASADLRPAVAKNVTTFAPKKPGIPKIGQTQNIASVTTKDGRQYDVTAEVFKDRDAVVMSPMYPSNIADDLAGAMEHQQSAIRAEARGMKLANDAPRAPDWATQNPKEWGDVQRQVGTRFLGMVNSTPGPHILALVDGIDINSLGSMIQDSLPKGKVLLKSPANGELAVVDRGAMPEQFQRWDSYNPRYGQSIGQLPPPAEWASAKPAATSATSSVTPLKPGGVVEQGPWEPLKPRPKDPTPKERQAARVSELRDELGLTGKQARMMEQSSPEGISARGQATPDFQRGVEVATLRGKGMSDAEVAKQLGIRGGKEELDRLEELVGAYDWGHPAIRPEFYAGTPDALKPSEIMELRQKQAKRDTVTPLQPAPKPPTRQGFGGSKLPMDEGAAAEQYWAQPENWARLKDQSLPFTEQVRGAPNEATLLNQRIGQIVRDRPPVRDLQDAYPLNEELRRLRARVREINAQSKSSTLLAGLGGPSGAGAAGGGILGYATARDANDDGVVDAQERANGVFGGAVSLGVGGAVAGKAFGARAAKRASGVQAQGFGAGRPKPPPAKGPPKPKSGMVGNLAQRAAVGAATGAAVNLATSAGAQEDISGKISITEQAIAGLNKTLADFEKLSPAQKQQALKEAGYYAGKIDSNIAGKTTEAIQKWKADKAAAISKAEADLTELVRRNAYQKNRPDEFAMAMREYAPTIAGVAAALGFKVLRGNAAKASIPKAAAASKDLNRLITKGPVTSFINKADTSRPANLNTLWQKGGAGKDELPFRQDAKGQWQPNPKAKPVEQLFNDNGVWQTITKYVKGKDLAIILGGGFDAVAMQPFIDKSNAELKEAEAEWKANPSDETFKRVEDAKNAIAAYTFVQRLGMGVAGGRILGSLGAAYAKPRPNIPMASTEQAALKAYIAGKKAPPKPRTPKLSVVPPSPQLPLPFGGGGNGKKP